MILFAQKMRNSASFPVEDVVQRCPRVSFNEPCRSTVVGMDKNIVSLGNPLTAVASRTEHCTVNQGPVAAPSMHLVSGHMAPSVCCCLSDKVEDGAVVR
jgi:hypothetical protein